MSINKGLLGRSQRYLISKLLFIGSGTKYKETLFVVNYIVISSHLGGPLNLLLNSFLSFRSQKERSGETQVKIVFSL